MDTAKLHCAPLAPAMLPCIKFASIFSLRTNKSSINDDIIFNVSSKTWIYLHFLKHICKRLPDPRQKLSRFIGNLWHLNS